MPGKVLTTQVMQRSQSRLQSAARHDLLLHASHDGTHNCQRDSRNVQRIFSDEAPTGNWATTSALSSVDVVPVPQFQVLDGENFRRLRAASTAFSKRWLEAGRVSTREYKKVSLIVSSYSTPISSVGYD